jgi:hypothetical protein
VRNVAPMLLDTGARDDKLAAHYARAHATPRLPPALAAAPALEVLNLLRRMTRVRVHNKRSEAVRRLVYNAILSADRQPHGLHPCVCGAVAPGLEHFFWSCPIADAVVRSIAAEVGTDRFGVDLFDRQALWLALPPKGVCPGVWDAVCLLALSAIYSKKQLGYKVLKAHALQAPPGAAVALGREAATLFWELLADYAVTCGPVPASWRREIGANHPFFSLAESGELRCRPRAAAAPAAAP